MNFIIEKSVKVIRKPQTNSRLKKGELPLSFRKVGAYIKDGVTGRGLNMDEEVYLLPSIIKIKPTSEHWDKMTEEYWADIGRNIDQYEGEELNAGWRFDNEKDMNSARKYLDRNLVPYRMEGDKKVFYGMPLNPADYVFYRHCLSHNRVANSIKYIDYSPKIGFYLYSREEEIKSTKANIQSQDRAMQEYLKVLSNSIMVDNILRMFGVNLAILSEDEKAIQLRTFAVERHEQFNEIVKDKDLRLKAFIEQAIKDGKLVRIQNTQKILYETTTVGNTMNEAVAFFKSNDPDAQRILKLIETTSGLFPLVSEAKKDADSKKEEVKDKTEEGNKAPAKTDDSK